MFGIDFSELFIILVIALIVVGPERLPKVARTLGHLWGRAQRYINGVKADIARDMAVEEFRQLQQKVQQEASNAEQAMKQVTQSVDQQVQQLNHAVEQPMRALKQQNSSTTETQPASSTSPQKVPPEMQPPAEQHKLPID